LSSKTMSISTRRIWRSSHTTTFSIFWRRLKMEKTN